MRTRSEQGANNHRHISTSSLLQYGGPPVSFLPSRQANPCQPHLQHRHVIPSTALAPACCLCQPTTCQGYLTHGFHCMQQPHCCMITKTTTRGRKKIGVPLHNRVQSLADRRGSQHIIWMHSGCCTPQLRLTPHTSSTSTTHNLTSGLCMAAASFTTRPSFWPGRDGITSHKDYFKVQHREVK